MALINCVESDPKQTSLRPNSLQLVIASLSASPFHSSTTKGDWTIVWKAEKVKLAYKTKMIENIVFNIIEGSAGSNVFIRI